ncbi:MAG: class I SAM-dependent methyltransferase [Chloroflexi bacterium]|nr:class I SAM-dependent methyltransferase [Chloroflexota bacterium]
MSVMKLFYEWVYRYARAPWDIGSRKELVELVESGRIQQGRAIDLGCGAGANAIYLAQKGFNVTGVDYAEAAIEKAQARAKEAGVQVNFIVDDLTNLRHVSGTFDFLLDYGVLDDLRLHQREPYLRNMLPLTHLGSQYLLWGFEYPIRWWEKFVPFFDVPFSPGEIERRFGQYFEIEKIAEKIDYSKWPPGYAAYLMTRNGETK